VASSNTDSSKAPPPPQPTEYAGCPGPTAPPQLLDTIMQSLVAYTEELPNVLPPVALDASSATWCDDSVGPTAAHDFVGVLAVNVLHISPFAVTEVHVAVFRPLWRCGRRHPTHAARELPRRR
jgi:hypothetical protein